jgi:V8-like Glu-specific endopeptidase
VLAERPSLCDLKYKRVYEMSLKARCTYLSFIYLALMQAIAAQEQDQTCSTSLELELAQRFQAAFDAKKKEGKPIYGCDDRKNFYDPTLTEHERNAAQATAVLIYRNQLERANLQQNRWNIQPRAGARKLCSPEEAVEAKSVAPERFWDEPLPGKCSSFKVSKRWMATAGHCIETQNECSKMAFVFGFHMTKAEDTPDKSIPSDRIYRCVRIIDRQKTDDSDWLIVEVERDIKAPLVKIRTKSTKPTLKAGTQLTVVGYPLGLPVKIAGGAQVAEIHRRYLTANLDTYHGNSGSAVLNSERLKEGELLAEGILVRGDADFEPESTCALSRKCPREGCRNEDVTLASEFVRVLNK